MSRKGGYVIADLEDINLTENFQRIPNIYKHVTELNRKVILISGLVISGVEYRDVFSQVEIKYDRTAELKVHEYISAGIYHTTIIVVTPLDQVKYENRVTTAGDSVIGSDNISVNTVGETAVKQIDLSSGVITRLDNLKISGRQYEVVRSTIDEGTAGKLTFVLEE